MGRTKMEYYSSSWEQNRGFKEQEKWFTFHMPTFYLYVLMLLRELQDMNKIISGTYYKTFSYFMSTDVSK